MLTIFQEFLPFPFCPAQIKFSGPIGKLKANLHSLIFSQVRFQIKILSGYSMKHNGTALFEKIKLF